MPKRLPKKLRAEPLIDASCELRTSSSVDLHTILPGLFFTQLTGITKVEQLPGLSFPDAMRADPALAPVNSQLVRLHWGDYYITLGTRNVLIGPRLPYRGWSEYKERVLEVFKLVLEHSFVQSIERYSIKYTNLIPISSVVQQSEKLDWSIKIGPIQLSGQPTQLRAEIDADGFVTIIEMATGAVVEMVGTKEQKEGCVVAIDTLRTNPEVSVAAFRTELADRLEAIRHYNKVVFFDCLKDSTIEEMGPTYE